MSTEAEQKNIRVIIADDHQLVREGIKRIINMEEDMEVIGECGDGIAIIEMSNALHPDVVIMDINMPIENGVSATEKLTEYFPQIKVIMLSIHDDETYVMETLRKGASGYLLKDMEAESLIQAIRNVMSGNAYIHPKVTGKLIQQLRKMTYIDERSEGRYDGNAKSDGAEFIPSREIPLTKRETEVLRLLAEGKSNKAIGEWLYISEKTVKNHVSSILQKMNVDDRTQAVIIAIKKGWVRL